MQLHHHISTPLTYFYDPSYKYVTTTYCDPSDDVAQLWTFNTTSNMIFTANDTNRCLSMVPNAINLNLDLFCQDAKVNGGVMLDGVIRTAYKLASISKACSEVLQEYGRWGGSQFNTHSNVVTMYDCFADGKSLEGQRVNEKAWHLPGMYDEQRWIADNNTGSIVNPRAGACLHVGGAMDDQCHRKDERVILHASPYPAYLYPCDRGCHPEMLQRW